MSVGFETDPNEPLPATGNFFQKSMANHFAGLGPVWDHVVADYKRPALETRWWHASNEEADRRQTSQLIAYAVTNAPTIVTYGWLMVEYELDFMYPELESLIGQENFDESINITTSPALAVNDPITATFSNSIGARILETIYTLGAGSSGYRAAGQNFDIVAGQAIFWAFSEAVSQWRAYRTLEGARTGSGNILTLNVRGVAEYAFAFKVRRLISSLTAT
jgi:hypothetical protein